MFVQNQLLHLSIRVVSTFVVMLAFIANVAGQQPAAHSNLQKELTDLLTNQATAWNDGDLERFMEAYWRSEKLTFSSGGNTTRSWQATLDRYRQRYGSKEKMGALKFSDLEVTPLGNEAALMLGRWNLIAEGQEFGGNFSLVWRKFDKEWKIIHDHTSSTETESDEPAKPDKQQP